MDSIFMICPFDPMHRVLKTRIQAHIVKCQKNHPGFETCPFNATHRILPENFKAHLGECPSRAIFFPEELPSKVLSRLARPAQSTGTPHRTTEWKPNKCSSQTSESVVSSSVSVYKYCKAPRSYKSETSVEYGDDWDD